MALINLNLSFNKYLRNRVVIVQKVWLFDSTAIYQILGSTLNIGLSTSSQIIGCFWLSIKSASCEMCVVWPKFRVKVAIW